MKPTAQKATFWILGILVVIVIVVVFATGIRQTSEEPEAGQPPSDAVGVPPGASEDARTSALLAQGSSSEAAAIEQDLNATQLTNLDSELTTIDQELTQELQGQ